MNITIKDIPEGLHARLKTAANESGRSLNKQILITLERALVPQKTDRTELLERVRDRRNRMDFVLNDEQVKYAIREGRE